MVDPVQVLPSEDERTALLDGLADLIDRIGIEPLVTGPLLRPSPEFFPDPWTPDLAGIRRLALRLLRYAGLEEFELSVELFEDEGAAAAADPYVHSERHSGAAAWFAGIRGGVVYFGANVSQLDDSLGLTAALAHETSHAFRFHHDLMVDDLELEEQLTDLTTVFLGFGLLTTNVALRHRSEVVAGSIGASQYRWSALGYLSPQALSFLLACHQRLREAKVREVVKQLESNQASYYRKARKWLDAHVPDLVERLGMPPRSEWPEPWSLEELVAPLDEEDESPGPEPSVPAVTRPPESVALEHPARPEPVLRVPDGDNRSIQLWAAILGLILTLFSTSQGVLPAVGMVLITVVVVRGLGRRKTWTCSACEAKVRREQTRCPECNGMFVMDLEDAADRLDVDPWDVLAQRRADDGAPGDAYRGGD